MDAYNHGGNLEMIVEKFSSLRVWIVYPSVILVDSISRRLDEIHSIMDQILDSEMSLWPVHILSTMAIN